MKILMISSDRKIFEKNSEVQKRMIDYGKIFDELHIIIFSDKNLGYLDGKLAENVFVYPTNHKHKFLYLFSIYKIVRRIIRNTSFIIPNSVVTSQDPFESGLAAWLISRWLKLPLHIQIHTDIFNPYFAAESALNKLRILLAKFLLPRAYAIRVVSERIKTSLNSKFQIPDSKIVVLPVFVDIKKIQSAKIKTDLHKKYPDNDFIILMASRLTREKNIGMAIEAFSGLLQSIYDSKFITQKNPLLLIVGDGPEESHLKSFASEYKMLATNIKFESWSSDLVSYYKTADLFLLTSNYEGYGRTVIEAMAAGLPVIMTDVGIAGEILIDDLDGKIISVGGTKDLIDVMSFLIGAHEKREDFIRNGNKVVESFPGRQEYLNLYKESFSIDNVIT